MTTDGLDEYRSLPPMRAMAAEYPDKTLYGWTDPRNPSASILADSEHVLDMEAWQ